MKGSIKEKTSITLSKEVLTGIDRIAGPKQSRSALIEAVLRQYLRRRARAQIEARDLELINKAAHELNAEVEDILRYQDPEA
jgi:metal-responsive CopG/Arc/MetJ family transcriptional regulator